VPGKVTGLRRSKTTAAGTTHFVWDQQNLLAELDQVRYYTDARWLQVRARELDSWTGRWLSRIR